MKTTEAWDVLATFVARHLPDSMAERRRTLTAFVAVAPAGKAREEAMDMLAHLDNHDIAQREMLLISDTAPAPATRGSARLGDRPLIR